MKQLSIVVWLDIDDKQLDLVETGIRDLIKGLNPGAQINIHRKEFNLNQPKT